MRAAILTTALAAAVAVSGAVAPAAARAVEPGTAHRSPIPYPFPFPFADFESGPIGGPGYGGSAFGGQWSMIRSDTNDEIVVSLGSDGGGRLYGRARNDDQNGTVRDGYVTGNSIAFTVDWGKSSVRYTGKLTSDRRLTGFMYNEANPTGKANWFTTRRF